jgi:tryptophanase
MMRGDESYAGASSFFRLQKVVHDLTGMPHLFPTHQGRAAERILCESMGLEGRVVLSNGLFDTTRANVEFAGAIGIDLTAGADEAPFGGNINLEAFDQALSKHQGSVAMVVMTVTNNIAAGQAVSLRNLREVATRCQKRRIPLVLDACRFAENAFRIWKDEVGDKPPTLHGIAEAMFNLADIFTMSAKKDAIVNMGGLLGMRDAELAEKVRVELIRTEGFVTYGGLAGRDLEAIAQGLIEVLDENYLEYRFAAARYLARKLEEDGWPVVQPAAAHAVYIDAGKALPHLPSEQFPGQSLACALYLAGGVRTCEIGSLMFGAQNSRQLVRLALPRRVYTQSHVDYVGAVAADVAQVKDSLPGLRVVTAPKVLRHFSAALEPLAPFPQFS